MENRVLLFDVMRIIAITLVLLFHASLSSFLDIPFFLQEVGIPGFANITGLNGWLAQWGVTLFIFVSGAVLEVSYGHKIHDSKENFDYIQFMKKRILRIYPVFIFAMTLVIVFELMTSTFPETNLENILATYTGFYPFYSSIAIPPYQPAFSSINGPTWFIGTIMCLYLLFPLLSEFLEKNGLQGLVLIFFATILIRTVLPLGSNEAPLWYWFPLSRIAEFALGMYIVQIGFYLKTENRSKILIYASDISFPVYLIHGPLLIILATFPKYYGANVIAFIVILLAFAILLNALDWNLKKCTDPYN